MLEKQLGLAENFVAWSPDLAWRRRPEDLVCLRTKRLIDQYERSLCGLCSQGEPIVDR
jgi:hypothetical protein